MTTPVSVQVPAEVREAPASLRTLVQDSRELYERLLANALGTRETAGACFYACVLLKTALSQFTPFRAVVRGGDGVLDGGYTDFEGRRHGHYWLEASCDAEGTWVLDITADQFGGPAVVLLPLEYSRPRYVPGHQPTVDAHVAEHGV